MKLQQIRKNKNLSQSQLAKSAGISTQVLQRYEMGFRNIDGAKLETLCNLAIALDCKLSDIIEDAGLIEKVQQTT